MTAPLAAASDDKTATKAQRVEGIMASKKSRDNEGGEVGRAESLRQWGRVQCAGGKVRRGSFGSRAPCSYIHHK